MSSAPLPLLAKHQRPRLLQSLRGHMSGALQLERARGQLWAIGSLTTHRLSNDTTILGIVEFRGKLLGK